MPLSKPKLFSTIAGGMFCARRSSAEEEPIHFATGFGSRDSLGTSSFAIGKRKARIAVNWSAWPSMQLTDLS